MCVHDLPDYGALLCRAASDPDWYLAAFDGLEVP